MQHLQSFLRWLRDFYVGLMLIPLWLWTVYYRILPTPHIAWVDDHWNLLCTLVFIHGTLALWQYGEKVAQAHAQQRSTRTLTGSVWILAVTLFLIGIGAILKSNGVFWGYGLLIFGTIVLPLLVFWLKGYETYQRKEQPPQVQAPVVNSGFETV